MLSLVAMDLVVDHMDCLDPDAKRTANRHREGPAHLAYRNRHDQARLVGAFGVTPIG
jgi:hypothetical protein